ncbi:MAG: NifB/NifX family molybdenum-iron cluster-binding protein [Bacteroidetes bacterium]|nr:NifB/NifX family molybdenum-iron cluster-binding protein [Bacteroidota bacterium]
MTAIGVTGEYFEAPLSECFGKSEYFFVYDRASGKYRFLQNPRIDEKEKSGKNAASFLVKSGVTTVMSYNVGSNAKKVFDRGKVQIVVLSDNFKTLKDVLKKMKLNLKS